MKQIHVILLCLLTSCVLGHPLTNHFDRVNSTVEQSLKKDAALTMSTHGVSLRGGKILEYRFSFDHQGPLSIETGRALTIKITSTVVEKFRRNPDIQHYLATRPFSYRNVGIFILSEEGKRAELPKYCVDCVMLEEGVLYFRQFDPKERKYNTLFSETYEEAVQHYQESTGQPLNPPRRKG